jgi:cell shape-determining protein MreC
MKRRHSHWLLVLLSLALTLSPERIRVKARENLLTILGKMARLLASPAEASSEQAGESSQVAHYRRAIHMLEVQNSRLKHALAQAGAVPELLSGQSVSLVPVDAAALTAGTSIRRRLLLTEGRNLGIDVGQSAVVGSALVGVVVQVSPRAAELRLILDPAFRIIGLVRATKIEGIVRGTAGDQLIFEVAAEEKSTRELPLRVGQEIMTSSRSSLCPIPSLIGRVVKVERFGALTRAVLAPAIDGRKLTSVVVLRPRETEPKTSIPGAK